MSIHLRIRQARLKAGLSQQQLAEMLGVTRSACNQWETEKGPAPKRGRLDELANILGVSFEWLATGKGTSAITGVAEGKSDYTARLSADQKELLKIYRAMTPKGRTALLKFLRTLA
ncbi:MAG: helix-turn-helix domain-containing protein [Gammaproteobacteria bacterium]